MVFTVLHPGPRDPRNGNDASCVIEIAAGNYRLLLMGDIEAGAEQRLLRRGLPNQVEFVTVPHHGSLTSSGPALVNYLRARLAVASTGYRNRWGFPHERVRARWQGSGSQFSGYRDFGSC